MLLPDNLNYRRWIVVAMAIWSGLMLVFMFVTNMTNFGLGETGLYLLERIYAVIAVLIGVTVSALLNSVE
jgi:small neutral amino acid transporter SnatA (MarC family)